MGRKAENLLKSGLPASRDGNSRERKNLGRVGRKFRWLGWMRAGTGDLAEKKKKEERKGWSGRLLKGVWPVALYRDLAALVGRLQVGRGCERFRTASGLFEISG